MTKIAKKARQELVEIDAQIKALQKRREELDVFIRVHSSLRSDESSVTERTKRSGQARIQIADATQRILADRQPQKTREIVQELSRQGIEIPGSNNEAYVSQVLSRERENGRFLSSRKKGWSLPNSGNVLRLSNGGSS